MRLPSCLLTSLLLLRLLRLMSCFFASLRLASLHLCVIASCVLLLGFLAALRLASLWFLHTDLATDALASAALHPLPWPPDHSRFRGSRFHGTYTLRRP